MAPTSGEARVCGYDVFLNPIEVKKRIGYLPETPPLYLDMLVEDYLKFVDKGVSGTQRKYNTPFSYRTKKPPISVIKLWTRVKGIPEEAAYPIQNKIFRFGLKPTNVINKSIREIEYRSRWINKFEESITTEILNMVKESFGYKNT